MERGVPGPQGARHCCWLVALLVGPPRGQGPAGSCQAPSGRDGRGRRMQDAHAQARSPTLASSDSDRRCVFYFTDDDSLARVECPAAELHLLGGALAQLLRGPSVWEACVVAQLARGHDGLPNITEDRKTFCSTKTGQRKCTPM